ncbi:MAG: heme biosynthesis HemY N-terminal domain-containing protein [Betaproteobacteria bacterium]
MKALFWGLLLAVVGIGVALLGVDAQGLVVFFAPPYRVELSFFLFVLLLLALLVATWLAAWLAQRVADFPRQVTAYRQRRADAGSRRALRAAIKALFEGRFARAEREARAAQATPADAGVAALIGARAAHRMQEAGRRDEWLERVDGDRDLAVAQLVSGAEMWAENHEGDRALAAIDKLQAGSGARSIHAARIALGANVQAGRWEQVVRGVQALAKRNAVNPVLADKYLGLAWRELLSERRHDPAALEAKWKKIPAAERQRPELALQGARLLNLAGRGHAAAVALQDALAAQWEPRLLDEYARARVFPGREQIERAEGWLESHPQDAALLRCLGLLCQREQLWGKAKSYLEDSLRQQPHPATVLALARLAEALGDEAEAARQYREAALGYANLAGGAGQVVSPGAPPVEQAPTD